MTDLRPPHELSERIERSSVALALASVDGDMPLLVANKAFYDLTGYGPDEVIGRNCRFLQGPDTPPGQTRAMHAFLHQTEPADGRFPILNYTKDGRRFTNLVFMSKLRSRSGELRFIIASQFDMSRAEWAEKLAENDSVLTSEIGDMSNYFTNFGLIMAESKELIARSISTLAKISVHDE